MKRAHRKAHRLIWIILTPLLLLIIYLAVVYRIPGPQNSKLPGATIQEVLP